MLILDDCLTALNNIEENSVDLVYLDPPFYTQKSHSQNNHQNGEIVIRDVWESRDYYLTYMAERLRLVHRVLKDTGSIFLQCDGNSEHHLRVLLDCIFGENNFRAEIIWSYRRWSSLKRGLMPAHQKIYQYSKTDDFKFNRIYTGYSPTTNIDQNFQDRERNEQGKTVYKSDEDGNIVLGGEKKGVPLSDVWEIPFLNPKARERTGYPTQKPIELIERIINIASDEGDIVLDPFCGSGTTLVAAKLLNRRYIGIDNYKVAIDIAKARLENPIKTTSKVLEVGINSYVNKSDEELNILSLFDCLVVQRNRGIDAFLKKHYLGAPVAIKIQRQHESLREAADLLYEAANKRKCSYMFLIANDLAAPEYPEGISAAEKKEINQAFYEKVKAKDYENLAIINRADTQMMKILNTTFGKSQKEYEKRIAQVEPKRRGRKRNTVVHTNKNEQLVVVNPALEAIALTKDAEQGEYLTAPQNFAENNRNVNLDYEAMQSSDEVEAPSSNELEQVPQGYTSQYYEDSTDTDDVFSDEHRHEEEFTTHQEELHEFQGDGAIESSDSENVSANTSSTSVDMTRLEREEAMQDEPHHVGFQQMPEPSASALAQVQALEDLQKQILAQARAQRAAHSPNMVTRSEPFNFSYINSAQAALQAKNAVNNSADQSSNNQVNTAKENINTNNAQTNNMNSMNNNQSSNREHFNQEYVTSGVGASDNMMYKWRSYAPQMASDMTPEEAARIISELGHRNNAQLLTRQVQQPVQQPMNSQLANINNRSQLNSSNMRKESMMEREARVSENIAPQVREDSVTARTAKQSEVATAKPSNVQARANSVAAQNQQRETSEQAAQANNYPQANRTAHLFSWYQVLALSELSVQKAQQWYFHVQNSQEHFAINPELIKLAEYSSNPVLQGLFRSGDFENGLQAKLRADAIAEAETQYHHAQHILSLLRSGVINVGLMRDLQDLAYKLDFSPQEILALQTQSAAVEEHQKEAAEHVKNTNAYASQYSYIRQQQQQMMQRQQQLEQSNNMNNSAASTVAQLMSSNMAFTEQTLASLDPNRPMTAAELANLLAQQARKKMANQLNNQPNANQSNNMRPRTFNNVKSFANNAHNNNANFKQSMPRDNHESMHSTRTVSATKRQASVSQDLPNMQVGYQFTPNPQRSDMTQNMELPQSTSAHPTYYGDNRLIQRPEDRYEDERKHNQAVQNVDNYQTSQNGDYDNNDENVVVQEDRANTLAYTHDEPLSDYQHEDLPQHKLQQEEVKPKRRRGRPRKNSNMTKLEGLED